LRGAAVPVDTDLILDILVLYTEEALWDFSNRSVAIHSVDESLYQSSNMYFTYFSCWLICLFFFLKCSRDNCCHSSL
jgi:hypothetical protein